MALYVCMLERAAAAAIVVLVVAVGVAKTKAGLKKTEKKKKKSKHSVEENVSTNQQKRLEVRRVTAPWISTHH